MSEDKYVDFLLDSSDAEGIRAFLERERIYLEALLKDSPGNFKIMDSLDLLEKVANIFEALREGTVIKIIQQD